MYPEPRSPRSATLQNQDCPARPLRMQDIELSIVVPVYNEKENIHLLYERLKNVEETTDGCRFRITFVDDRSRDGTFDILKKLADEDDCVSVIRMAKNCGSHVACSAGLHHATGDCAVVMAADLQDPPEIIPELLACWQSGEKGIVWAARRSYEGRSLFQRITGGLYWLMMRSLRLTNAFGKGADFYLVDRKVLDVFRKMPERNRSIISMLAWLGFDQGTVLYNKVGRKHGKSKWTFAKKVKLFIDGIVGYTHLPMRIMSLAGLLLTVVSALYGTIVVVNAIGGNPVQGWASLMVVLLLVSGMQMAMLGILGEYIWRTLDEARGRPYYVIEETLNLPGPEDEGSKTAGQSRPTRTTESPDASLD